MSNKVEGWLLKLHGWVAVKFLEGWCHSSSIACLLKTKLSEEVVEAGSLHNRLKKKPKQNQNPKPQQIPALIVLESWDPFSFWVKSHPQVSVLLSVVESLRAYATSRF